MQNYDDEFVGFMLLRTGRSPLLPTSPPKCRSSKLQQCRPRGFGWSALFRVVQCLPDPSQKPSQQLSDLPPTVMQEARLNHGFQPTVPDSFFSSRNCCYRCCCCCYCR
ncbi:unnamed protein product [Ectocarpus sp. 8 AP-2014]